jgi:DNA-binding IclR family transcriptional regulator
VHPGKAGRPSGNAPRTAKGGATVPAAGRAKSMFEIFAREQRELTKSDVARLLDLPESSTSDLLNTLHSIGYLSRTATTRRYYPTGRLLSVANDIAANDPLLAFGAEACGLLSQRTGETASLSTLAGANIKIHAVSQGRHRLRYVVNVGDSFSIHGTAQGKALLSSMDPDERGRLLRLKPLTRLTPNTRVEPREIELHVDESKARGWFASQDEGTVGVSSFAIAGRVGMHDVSLGIIGPTERLAGQADRFVPMLLEAGETVFGD